MNSDKIYSVIFKDREDAGKKLSEEFLKEKDLLKKSKDITVVSLLRGGIVVGKTIAQRLKLQHIPLTVTKITSPYNPELAIGAICFDVIFLQKEIIKSMNLKEKEIQTQKLLVLMDPSQH